MPLFEIAAFKVDFNSSADGKVNLINDEKEQHKQQETMRLSSLKMTTVANDIIKRLNVDTRKRWSGVKFFGLDRSDVKLIMERSNDNNHQQNITKPCTREDDNDQENPAIVTEQLIQQNKNCTWLGVKTFGNVVIGEFASFYERKFKRNSYTAHRGVACNTGKNVLVTCKIDAYGPMPFFLCEADNEFN